MVLSVALLVFDSNLNALPSTYVVDPTRGNMQYIYFPAVVPPLGLSTYFLRSNGVDESPHSAKPGGRDSKRKRSTAAPGAVSAPPFMLTNGVVSIQFDQFNRLSSWSDLVTGMTMNLTQEFWLYTERRMEISSNVCTGTNVTICCHELRAQLATSHDRLLAVCACDTSTGVHICADWRCSAISCGWRSCGHRVDRNR